MLTIRRLSPVILLAAMLLSSQTTFTNGAPFTFDQVLRFVREKAIPVRRQKEAIQNRGLDFSASVENLQKLEAAGAPADMLELITKLAKPLPAEPVVHGITERVVVAPNRGKIVPATGPGPKPAPVEPQPTKEAAGADLFSKMLLALGGEASIPQALWFQAEGSATIRASDGRSARWNIFIRSKPGRSLFQVMGGGAFHEVAFDGRQFKTSKGLKGDDARELPTSFGLILENQIAALIARLNTPKFKVASSEPLTLIAESNTETVSIRLDNDLRPAHVKISTATGLGSGVVTYSDYMQRGNVYYPQSVQIKPDSTQHGIDVRFDRVDLSPKLKDGDYALNGKPLGGLAR